MVHCVINFIHMWVLPLWSISYGNSTLSMLLKFSHGNIFTHTNNCNCVIDFSHKCIEFSSRDRFLLMWFYQSLDNFIFMVIFGSISSINNVFFLSFNTFYCWHLYEILFHSCCQTWGYVEHSCSIIFFFSINFI